MRLDLAFCQCLTALALCYLAICRISTAVHFFYAVFFRAWHLLYFYVYNIRLSRHVRICHIFGLTDYAVVPPVIGLVSRFIGSNTVGLAMGILLAFIRSGLL